MSLLVAIPAFLLAFASDEQLNEYNVPEWAARLGLRRFSDDEKEMLLSLGLLYKEYDLPFSDISSITDTEFTRVRVMRNFKQNIQGKNILTRKFYCNRFTQKETHLHTPIIVRVNYVHPRDTSYFEENGGSTDIIEASYEVELLEYTDEMEQYRSFFNEDSLMLEPRDFVK